MSESYSAERMREPIFRHWLFSSALNASHGSIKDTMVQLGIARKTLYDKMRKHGLDKAQFKD